MEIQAEFDETKWYKDDPRHHINKRERILIYDIATRECVTSFVDTKNSWSICPWPDEDNKWFFGPDDHWNEGLVWCRAPERDNKLFNFKKEKEARKPNVITLCGSTRFMDEFHNANMQLTLKGNVVISVGFFGHSLEGKYTITDVEKENLDELHKRKIDLSNEIYVINVDGYVGESTCGEIMYARKTGKKINWLEPDKALPENMDLSNLDFIECSKVEYGEEEHGQEEEETRI